MAEGFDFRLVSHDNLCTHCVYAWPESVGFSCSVLRGKRCKALVYKCGQYEPFQSTHPRGVRHSMAVPVMRWIGKRIQEVADDAD